MSKKNSFNDITAEMKSILDRMSKEEKETLKKNVEIFLDNVSGKLDGLFVNFLDCFPNEKEMLKKVLSKSDDTVLTDEEIEKNETVTVYKLLKTMNFDLQKNYLDLLVIDYYNESVRPKSKYHLALMKNFIRKNDFTSFAKLKDYEVEDEDYETGEF